MITLTIKNLKYAEFASEETHCFEATLYVDGKPMGRVSNDGHGGANMYDFDERELDATIKAADVRFEFYGRTMTKDLEIVVGDLVSEALLIKDAKAFRTKIAKKSGYKPDQIRIFVCGNSLTARGINEQSDDEIAAEIGEGARRIDNATPVVTI